MKNLKTLLCLMLCLLLTPSLVCAEEAAIATVNGESISYEDYNAIESAYIYQYQLAGVDMTDPTYYAYVQDLALTYVIQQCLVKQDMKAQDCYAFTQEEETWCAEQGKAAWEQALADVGEMLRESLGLVEDEDVASYALSYAEALGVNEQTYVDEYRTQLALVKYYDWLLGGAGVSDEEVQAAYEARVAAGEALYANDAAAFEEAIYAGSEVWYMPAGYRRVLQILLVVEGETEEERLANAAAQVAQINALLEAGESFQSLIPLYGSDANFNDEAFYQTGYSVHRDSVMWEDAFVAAAFAPEMVAPGCWSQPFASTLGVHILYYLEDVPGGPVELTEDMHDMLASVIYEERASEAMAQRLDVLAAEADVVIY
ncbi:MAG: hypothetical protein IJE07_12240 [Clostridia bacterium]|nr:hypothetical protein [Clostridia bacterium]